MSYVRDWDGWRGMPCPCCRPIDVQHFGNVFGLPSGWFRRKLAAPLKYLKKCSFNESSIYMNTWTKRLLYRPSSVVVKAKFIVHYCAMCIHTQKCTSEIDAATYSKKPSWKVTAVIMLQRSSLSLLVVPIFQQRQNHVLCYLLLVLPTNHPASFNKIYTVTRLNAN